MKATKKDLKTLRRAFDHELKIENITSINRGEASHFLKLVRRGWLKHVFGRDYILTGRGRCLAIKGD